jgi:hypothetical protein
VDFAVVLLVVSPSSSADFGNGKGGERLGRLCTGRGGDAARGSDDIVVIDVGRADSGGFSGWACGIVSTAGVFPTADFFLVLFTTLSVVLGGLTLEVDFFFLGLSAASFFLVADFLSGAVPSAFFLEAFFLVGSDMMINFEAPTNHSTPQAIRLLAVERYL